MDAIIHNKIALMLANPKYNQQQNNENNWCLFSDDEQMEREFWLLQLQSAIRQSLHTLKLNANELPLAKMREDEELKMQENQKFDNMKKNPYKCHNHQNHNHSHSITFNYNNNNNDTNNNNEIRSSKGPAVTQIDKDGRVASYKNLEDLKLAMDKKIDEKVEQRLDRNQVFRNPNPWTYTVEEAADLDLLPEIPKDFLNKQKELRQQKYRGLCYKHRIAAQFEDANFDDGSRLSKDPNEIEYHKQGTIKTYTMRDMPKSNSEKDIDDMDDEEYDHWVKEKRKWDNWKDDHERGAGNPFR